MDFALTSLPVWVFHSNPINTHPEWADQMSVPTYHLPKAVAHNPYILKMYLIRFWCLYQSEEQRLIRAQWGQYKMMNFDKQIYQIHYYCSSIPDDSPARDIVGIRWSDRDMGA